MKVFVFLILSNMLFVSCSFGYFEKEEEALFEKSLQLYEEEEFDSAIVQFREVADRFENSSYYEKSWYYIGECWVGKFNDTITNTGPRFQFLDNAINSYEKVTSQSSYWVKSLFGIGYSYYELGGYDSSYSYHKNIFENFPHSSKADNALLYIGHYYRKTGNLDSALVCFEKVIADYPTSGAYDNALYWAGDNYYDRRNLDLVFKSRAIELFTEYCNFSDQQFTADGIPRDDKYEKAKNKLVKMGVIL